LLLTLAMVCEYRFHIGATYLWDAAIIITGTFIYSIISIPIFFTEVLAFLGKHSFNIFLFHTFILGYYFHDYIYWSRNPLFIYLTLLVVCILFSIFVEWSKQYFQINILQNKLMGAL
jgi:peptidoglycan/LPS O-acetylase OafA/YrhL